MDNELTKVIEERSYISCLSLGWRTAMNHIGMLLRYVWPSMLLTLILPLPGILFFAGQTDALLCKWVELGYVPQASISSLRREILHRTGRNCFNLLLTILVVLLFMAVGALVFLLHSPLWTLWAAMAVLVIIVLPLEVCMMDISYSQKPLMACLGSYLTGWRHWSTIFVFELVGVIFLTLACMVCTLPAFTVCAAWRESYLAQAQGDVTDLPLAFPLLVILAWIIMGFVTMCCMMIYSFCHCLLWGSIVKSEEQRVKSEE